MINLVSFAWAFERYIRGRLLRDGVDIDELDGVAALDVLESLAVDMNASGAARILDPDVKHDWPGWLAWADKAPVVMSRAGPVQLGARRETWGIDLADFDEPEPAPLRDDVPEEPGATF